MSGVKIIEDRRGFYVHLGPDYKSKLSDIRSIVGAKFYGPEKGWFVPFHREREIEMLKKKYGIMVDPVLNMPEQIGEIPPMPELTIDLPLLMAPRPYQNTGIAKGIEWKKFLNADEMGLGKTLMAIATMVALECKCILVICPNTLKPNWEIEWRKVVGWKTMELGDKSKTSWQTYHKVGMINVFIINYSRLKSFFVAPGWEKPKGKFNLKDIPFRDCIKLFDGVIVDESKECFPYETKILTNKGLIPIGEIIEKKDKSLLVASVNIKDFSLSYNKIKTHWKNNLRGREIFHIVTNAGELYATGDHKIYTAAGRYKKVSEIKSGEGLYMLRDYIFGKEARVECVRVESIEIYEPTSPEQYGYGSVSSQTVYDLEIENNHNYFADGILVSNCKEGKTLQSRLTRGICHGKKSVILLNGTPVVNKPKDLAAQLLIIGKLKEIVAHIPDEIDPKTGQWRDPTGYNRYLNRYCEGANGKSNLKELHFRLKTICMFRREKKDVAADLPEIVRQIIMCKLSNQAEYDKAEKDFVNYLKTIKGCTDEEIEKKLRGQMMVKMGVLLYITGRGKLEAAQEHINEVVDGGQKIVVFYHLVEILKELKTLYPDSASICGKDENGKRQLPNERQKNIERFQTIAECMQIMCSIKAGGVGTTLTAASEILLTQLPWTETDISQLIARIHRIGQTAGSCRAAILIAKATIDEYVYNNIILPKREMHRIITGSSDTSEDEVVDIDPKSFDVDDMLNFFTNREKEVA